MSNHEYYSGPPPGDQGQSHGHAGANPPQGYGSHDVNHAPQGQGFAQQKYNQNGYAHSPYPQDPVGEHSRFLRVYDCVISAPKTYPGPQ